MAVEKLTSQTFEQFIQSGTAVVDFYADWCGPCRMLAPIMESVAGERPDVLVAKVNVDENPGLASEFGVFSIPSLVVLKNGRVVNQAVGVRPKDQILSLLS